MKSIILTFLISCSLVSMQAQVSFNQLSNLAKPPVFGPSPFQDSLWAIDTVNLGVVYRSAPNMAGFTITGLTGMTIHPHTGEYFVIMKLSGVLGRVLGKYNIVTGTCSQIGNLGDNFSTISFREDGQLFGVTGNGATVPETLFLIDDSTAATTLASPLGAGADGEIIAFNHDDDFFYHWSGNGTIVYEKVMSIPPYTATNIPIIGTTNGETFGAAYLGSNKFLTSDILSRFNHCLTTGEWSPPFGNNPDDLRGLGLVGRWVHRPGNDTICSTDSALFETFATSGVPNRHKFQWVKNGINIPGATSSTYYANQTGWYNCRIILDSMYVNNQTMDSNITVYTDTAWYGRYLKVLNSPVVSLIPSPTTYLCDVGDSTLLTGSAGGTSQWYMNGTMIVGANTNTYYASTPGVYNMTKTNLNGCTDSAAVGTIVLFSPTPTLASGPNTCVGDSIQLSTNSGATQYDWLLNGSLITTTSVESLYVNATGNYSVITTYGSCADTSNVVSSTFYPLPLVNLTPSPLSYICSPGDSVLLTGTSGGTSQWYLYGSPIAGATSNAYYTNVPGYYNMTKTNTNGCTDSAATPTQVLNAPVFDISPTGSSTICYGGQVTLIANPGADSYAWLMNGTVIAGATSNTFNADTTGTYTCITSISGCTDTTSTSYTLTVIDCSGIEENVVTGLHIYPNPAQELIQISSDIEVLNIEILDIVGHVIIRSIVNSSNPIISIEILIPGIYLITTTSEKGSRSGKFIKN